MFQLEFAAATGKRPQKGKMESKFGPVGTRPEGDRLLFGECFFKPGVDFQRTGCGVEDNIAVVVLVTYISLFVLEVPTCKCRDRGTADDVCYCDGFAGRGVEIEISRIVVDEQG